MFFHAILISGNNGQISRQMHKRRLPKTRQNACDNSLCSPGWNMNTEQTKHQKHVWTDLSWTGLHNPCDGTLGSAVGLKAGNKLFLCKAGLLLGTACWSSWADCLEMIAARNPGVADLIVTEMGQAEAGFHVAGASQAREQLVSAGFNAPHWRDLREGLRPPGQPVVGIPGHGWQHEATEAVHAVVFQHHHLATSLSVMSGVPFTCFLVSRS